MSSSVVLFVKNKKFTEIHSRFNRILINDIKNVMGHYFCKIKKQWYIPNDEVENLVDIFSKKNIQCFIDIDYIESIPKICQEKTPNLVLIGERTEGKVTIKLPMEREIYFKIKPLGEIVKNKFVISKQNNINIFEKLCSDNRIAFNIV